MINRIDIDKPLNETEGFDMHDFLREGRQYELSPRKVAAFLRILYKKINELVDDVNRYKKKDESGIQVQINVSQSPSSNLNKNK